MRDLTSATTQIARDSKPDNEIMMAITVVTMICLPATFVAVCTLSIYFISGLPIGTQTLMSMGFFDFYLPDGTSSVVAGLRVSGLGMCCDCGTAHVHCMELLSLLSNRYSTITPRSTVTHALYWPAFLGQEVVVHKSQSVEHGLKTIKQSKIVESRSRGTMMSQVYSPFESELKK